jgi:hypothetical protein
MLIEYEAGWASGLTQIFCSREKSLTLPVTKQQLLSDPEYSLVILLTMFFWLLLDHVEKPEYSILYVLL